MNAQLFGCGVRAREFMKSLSQLLRTDSQQLLWTTMPQQR